MTSRTQRSGQERQARSRAAQLLARVSYLRGAIFYLISLHEFAHSIALP